MSDARRIRVLGGELSVESHGSGARTIVLLHKLGGSGAEWRRIVPALATLARVVVIDFPGHGRSRAAAPPPFLVPHEELACQALQLLDEIDATAPSLWVGSSIGASVSLLIAALWPSRCTGVISLGASFGAGLSRGVIAGRAAEAQSRGEIGADDVPRSRTRAEVQSSFGIEDVSVADEMVRTRDYAAAWTTSLARGLDRCDVLGALPRITSPVTLGFGERGHYGQYVGTAMARLRSAQVHAIPDSGAFPHEEAPEAVIALVHGALADVGN